MPVATKSQARVTLSEDGYTIWGLEPPDLQPMSRKLFWGWCTEFGLKEKDRDLAKGLDKDGKPLKPISEETRKHRRSAMTPSGKGDPSAPPLIPGWQKSRTRSLLTGKPFMDHAEFWWKYDAYTADSWARILEAQAAKGRDVFGLSPAALKRVQTAAWKRWEQYKIGKFKPKPEATELAPLVGDLPDSPLLTEHAIGLTGEITDRRGFLTQRQFREWFRQTAPAQLEGRPTRPLERSPIAGPQYNRLLSYVHQKRIAPPTMTAIPVSPPKPTLPKPPRAPRVPKAPAKPPTFEEALEKALRAAEERTSPSTLGTQRGIILREAIIETIKAHVQPGPTGTFHGMDNPETFQTLKLWGINWHFSQPIDENAPIVRTLTDFRIRAGPKVTLDKVKIPERLANATKDVYFTNQSNNKDDYWKKKYNSPNHVSAATGGDGRIVVYNNERVDKPLFGHESGHNLAKQLYGATDPTNKSDSDYAYLAIKTLNPTLFKNVEMPVSAYGKNSPSEDFAEAASMYIDEPDKMKRDFPERYAIMHKIMTDLSYGG